MIKKRKKIKIKGKKLKEDKIKRNAVEKKIRHVRGNSKRKSEGKNKNAIVRKV